MTRRVLPAVALFVLAVAAVPAQPPAPPAPKPDDPQAAKPEELTAEALARNKRLKEQYQEFEATLARVAQRLARSEKPEDQQKAAALQQALQVASDEGIEKRFEALIRSLQTSKLISENDVSPVIRQNTDLVEVMDRIIAILSSQDEDARRKDEIKRLTDLLKELDKIIFAQKLERANTEAGRAPGKQLAEGQKKVTNRTENLDQALDKKNPKPGEPKAGEPKPGQPKPGEPKPGDPKPGDPKPGEPKPGDPKPGDPKPGEPKPGEPKPGQPKPGDPKPGDPKPGEPKPGQPQQQPPQQQPQQPGQKPLKDAIKNQQQAERNLQKDEKPKASEDQDRAIRDLVKAREEMEKRLKQLREEERMKLLQDLEARVRAMLKEQREVLDGTRLTWEAVEKQPDRKPGRAQQQQAQALSDREKGLVGLASDALELLKDEGSSVAFALGFRNVRSDMLSVMKRLDRADVGPMAQTIEQRIIIQLEKMLAALQKAQQDLKNPPPPPPPGQPPDGQQQQLINRLNELKLIREMQLEVNDRTKLYYQQDKAEQADDPQVAEELRELAKRQQEIYEATRALATGKNR
jgi:hypothetical protein